MKLEGLQLVLVPESDFSPKDFFLGNNADLAFFRTGFLENGEAVTVTYTNGPCHANLHSKDTLHYEYVKGTKENPYPSPIRKLVKPPWKSIGFQFPTRGYCKEFFTDLVNPKISIYPHLVKDAEIIYDKDSPVGIIFNTDHPSLSICNFGLCTRQGWEGGRNLENNYNLLRKYISHAGVLYFFKHFSLNSGKVIKNYEGYSEHGDWCYWNSSISKIFNGDKYDGKSFKEIGGTGTCNTIWNKTKTDKISISDFWPLPMVKDANNVPLDVFIENYKQVIKTSGIKERM